MNASAASDFEPAEKFVLRTPYLSFDELEPVEELARRADVREALYLASPDLVAALDRSAAARPSAEHARIARSLYRYLSRMASRPTPFGLFAGWSVGEIGTRTRLELDPRPTYRRTTRLRMSNLVALAHRLQSLADVRRTLTWHTNRTLHHAAGRYRYIVEERTGVDEGKHRLVALDLAPQAVAVLHAAEQGAGYEDLLDVLKREAVSERSANALLERMIDSQVLVSDLWPRITGDVLEGMRAGLRGTSQGGRAVRRLSAIDRVLAAFDSRSSPVDIEHYRRAAELVRRTCGESAGKSPFVVDLHKPASLAIEPAVSSELLRGAILLFETAAAPANARLDEFRTEFVARYDGQEVPLLEALDEDIGIGFGGHATRSGGTSMWGSRDEALLRLVSAAVEAGDAEVVLTDADIDALRSEETNEIPDAFAVVGSVAAKSVAAIAAGDFRVFVQGAEGPSGVRLLARQATLNEQIEDLVRDHVRREEALADEAVFAEVVHLPVGGAKDMVRRPVLRTHEIACLGSGSAAAESTIPLDDLMVSVRHGRIVLRSRRVGVRVLPRISSAHNYDYLGPTPYRFLGALQEQGVRAGAGWDWGPLSACTYLPRISYGRLVLARQQWRLNPQELSSLVHAGAVDMASVHALRCRRRLPRWVVLVGVGDKELVVDLGNPVGVECLIAESGVNGVRVTELFPDPEHLPVRGPEGRYVHQILLPFTRRKRSSEIDPAYQPEALSVAPTLRRRMPGSDWLYLKVYTGTAMADRLLLDVLAPALRELCTDDDVWRWFFVRYRDADGSHLRVRVNGSPRRLLEHCWPTLHAVLEPAMMAGGVRRVQLDTYERELERYGGPDGTLLAERFFHADSEAVVDVLSAIERRALRLTRMEAALLGVDTLLSECGFSLEAKRELVRNTVAGMLSTLGFASTKLHETRRQVRAERDQLNAVLSENRTAQQGFSTRVDAGLRGWLDRATDPRQRQYVVASCCHMFLNRLFSSEHAERELQTNVALDQLYTSQLARAAQREQRS